ncbi:hypothetical protein LSTR_LSTR007923 [Laodelphax striatellus]|uniref:Uncharacterized protein n=1 Tax=Laodelphax striatellus TaxID=195883 RepID=A0A482XLF5_LAOST|nr:hypothetical protein LSTR_LSTR007923 [Laodelphax striatellus]
MDTNGTVPNFDYSCEITSNYFKSSFARSMAFSNSNQSKSLDYVYFDRATINEECETDNQKLTADDSSVGIKAFSPLPPRSYQGSPTINNHQVFTSPDFGKINGRNGNKTNDALKLWNMKKETLKREEESKENNQYHHQNNHQQIEDNCNELIRLRKECQNLMEENRRLQQVDPKRPSPAHSPTTSIDISYLQSQVDTLQWQLKQAESSRQMYRAVLEQVSRFLERVHKNLDQANGVKPCNSKAKSSRVPRSRSVHTVATTTSSSSYSSSHSRPSSPSPSPSPTPTPSYVHRASSIAQMQESHSYATLRDHWRGGGSRNSAAEEVPVDKLAQEAFRMLRTVQSLLGTREPDLMAHRPLTPHHTPTPTPATSISETLNDSGSERRDSTSVGSCSSLLLQSSCGGLRKSLDCASSINSLGSCSRTRGRTPKLIDDVEAAGTTPTTASSSTSSSPPLAGGGTEDESGFSSMSSFHEVGLPDLGGGGLPLELGGGRRGGGYPELGLPLVEPPPNHRRWSSTPVDTHFHTGEAIRVLWV